MNVLGLDLSLTAPGVAFDGHPTTLLSTRLTGVRRLNFRAGQILGVLEMVKPDFVVVEGYAMGHTRNMAGARSVAELGGVARLLMFEKGIPFAEVPPSTLKKYATGSGAAKKEQMIAAALEAGASIPTRPKPGGGREHDDNAADAWWLFQMGLAHYEPSDARVATRPPLNRQSLDSVKWPRIARKANA